MFTIMSEFFCEINWMRLDVGFRNDQLPIMIFVLRAKNSDYKPGETWYVISGKWWNAWKKYTRYDVSINLFESTRTQHSDDSFDKSILYF